MKYAIDFNIYSTNSTLLGNLSLYSPDIQDNRVWPFEYILEITKDIDGVDFLRVSIKCKSEEDQIIIGNNIINLLNDNSSKVGENSEVKYHYCHADKITPGRCSEEVIWRKSEHT